MSKVKPFTPQRVAKLVRNPGDRAKVPTRLLPEKYRKIREMNARLNAPVTAGSSMTNRDLSHLTSDAVTQRYGQRDLAETKALADQRAMNNAQQGWYAEYVKQLQAHAQNFQAQQPIQFAGMPGASADQQAAITNRVNSWQGQAGIVNQANAAQASNLANVVGPGLKIQAGLAGNRKVQDLLDKRTQTADEKGAFARQFKVTAVQDEAKSALAAAIANGKQSVAEYNAKTQRINANKPSGKSPPVPWYTWKQWNSLSTEQKRGAIKDYKSTKGTTPGKGTTPKSPYSSKSVQSTAWQKIEAAAAVIKSTYRGKSFEQISGAKTPVHGAQLRAAWEIANRGRISSGTARQLHADGLQVNGRYPVDAPVSKKTPKPVIPNL